MIDISKIKPGDYVTVRAKVLRVCANAYEEFEIRTATTRVTWVSQEEITSHEPTPEPLKVGDVVFAGGVRRHIIAGLHNDTAWLVRSTGYSQAELSKLRRVTEP